MHLCRDHLFSVVKKSFTNTKDISNKFVSLLNGVNLLTSKSPGLGKTFYVEELSRKTNKQLKYFPICGNVSFTRLSQRLKSLKL